jgi:hypothetical protein
MRGVSRRLVESRLAELGMEAIEDLSNAEESK